MSTGSGSPWNAHATQWHKVGCPLRPCSQDIEIFQDELTRFTSERDQVQALLLGITAELTGLDWPRNTALLAVDSSHAMMHTHWSPPRGITSLAVLGLWERMPLQARSIDLILADGSLSILANATALATVIEQLADIVRPGGCIVMRSFVRPVIRELPDQVFAAMWRGQIGNFHVLKWRLLMSMHDSSPQGVVLSSVHRMFRDVVPDSRELAKRLGWPVASIDTIESYRNASGRYFFPTLPQLRELLSNHFSESNHHLPDYELGQQCPLLVLRRKSP